MIRLTATEIANAARDELWRLRNLMFEKVVFEMIQRQLGPSCPPEAEKIIEALAARGLEIVHVVPPFPNDAFFVIKRGEEVIDRADTPRIKL